MHKEKNGLNYLQTLEILIRSGSALLANYPLRTLQTRMG